MVTHVCISFLSLRGWDQYQSHQLKRSSDDDTALFSLIEKGNKTSLHADTRNFAINVLNHFTRNQSGAGEESKQTHIQLFNLPCLQGLLHSPPSYPISPYLLYLERL